MSKTKKEVKSILTDETVIVKFVPNFANGIMDKKHPLYGGFSSNASLAIPAPLLTRKIEKIFTTEEIEALKVALPGEDLTPQSDFWKEFSKDKYGMPRGHFPIFLKKEGAMFNKKHPIEFIKIRVLEAANNVAIDMIDAKNRASEIKFVLIKNDEIHKEDSINRNFKKDAMKLHTKYENDASVLRHVLKAFNKNVSYNSKMDFLQNETWKMLEINPALFVKTLSDDYLHAKIVLDNAIRYKLVSRSNKLYYTLSGDPIRLDGENNTYDGAAKFLDSGAGQEYKLELEALIKDKQ